MKENRKREVLGHGYHRFQLLIAGQAISSIGSGISAFGLSIYILNLTGSVTATGIFSICAFLPSILLAPIGGILADKYDRRWMMILGELLSVIGLAICLIAVMSKEPKLIWILVGIALSSVFTGLTETSFKASVTDLLPVDYYAKASGMIQLANSAKLIISPVIAGFLLQITDVSFLIIIDILTFFTTATIILFVKKGMPNKDISDVKFNIFKEFEVFKDVLKDKIGIKELILVMTISTFCLGFIQVLSKPLILAFATQAQLGIVSTIIAVGMIAGSIVVGWMKEIKSYVRLLSAGLMGCGIFFSLVGVKENLILVACFGFMMFAFMPGVQIGAEVLVRKNIPNEMQGIVFGFIGMVTQLGYIVSFILSGILSDYIFEPFMNSNGMLALMIGRVIGSGIGRGIAFMIILVGIGMFVLGVIVSKLEHVKSLESGNNNETII